MKAAAAGSGGWTVVEALVATAVTAALSAMGYSFATAALAAARLHEVKSEALEGVATTLDMLTRELRMAGAHAPSGACATCEGVRAAGATRVEIDADLNTDGDVADANEIVAYSYDSAARQVERSTGAGSPQPLLRNVPADGLQFAYFDVAGNPLAAAAGLTAADRQRVHRIDVTLTAAPPNPNRPSDTPLPTTLSTSICLRNR